MSAEQESCGTCRFRIDGKCVRHAPIGIHERTFPNAKWPSVNRSMWCGDFERRPDVR